MTQGREESSAPSPLAQTSVPGGAAPEDQGHPAARSLTQLDNSQSAIRDTTKWLVAAAAAVGGVVVAGLQLSNLPKGSLATTIALFGFTLALGGVAAIIFSAASVLSVGFTTLGQLAKLYESEADRLTEERDWQTRIDKAMAIGERAPSGRRLRSVRVVLWRVWAWVLTRYLLVARKVSIERIRSQGVWNAELVDYLDEDAIVFSNGLAKDIPELYDRLTRTDLDIIRLHGETPSKLLAADSSESPPPLTDANQAEALDQALWRSSKLETAAGMLIAFANQRVIERRFDRLKWSVRLGGIAVAVGVGLFAIAPKLAQSKPLSVTKPTPVTVFLKRPHALGPDCDATSVKGVAVGGTWTKPIVVTGVTSSCPGRELTLTSDIGYAVPSVPSTVSNP